jgi:DNA-binding NarL/FixJ family response regulator
MERIKLIVVDDHPLFRQGVVDVFSLEPDLFVVGQAENGEEALRLIQSLQPDIAILDINLPGLNGQQVLRQVVNDKLRTKIILLTAYHDSAQVGHAMRGGAAAYCSKDVQPERLVWVIRQVSRGMLVMDDQAFDQSALNLWLETQIEGRNIPSTSNYSEIFSPLSSREMEVLACLTRGMSNKEIAVNLKISHQTVKNHVTAILRKLNLEDRTQAAIYALQRGWVKLDQNTQSQE